MKILFDSQIFDEQKYGGISRYFTELFKCFNNENNIQYELPIKDTRNEYLKNIKPFSNMDLSKKFIFPNINFKLQRIFSKIYNLISPNSNINKTKKALKKQDFDIFHPTYYSTYFLKYLKDKPLVLTVHDMIHELYPEYFNFNFGNIIHKKKILILRADKIIAISENTKKDIIKLYNISEDKIKVIYHGNSLQPVKGNPVNAPELPSKYILFVGAREIYKNFTFFIEAISSILNKDKNIHVVVAGGYSGKNTFTKDEKKLFKKLDIEDQIVHYSIDDKVLAYLYQNALCFVFPTLYEGFGIPILESFACGCPVVISSTSSLPEVGGDAVIYFNPKNSEDILNSVKKVIYNEDLRKELIIKGKEQLKKFSWDKASKETLDLYRSIL
jgi:glycosyltransferase involved in cell wall biosynthesis